MKPYQMPFNPFPNRKVLDMTKLKAFADDKLNAAKIIISGYQHFLLFPQCFQKPSSLWSLKSGLCGKESTA